MSDCIQAYRVVGWDQRYETRATLKRGGARASVPLSTNVGQVAFQKLLKVPGSAEILGIWLYLQMLVANCDRRGVLVELGRALTAGDLARNAGWEVPRVEWALGVLCSPEIGLLEQVSLEESLRPPVIPPAAPRKPRNPQPPPLAECPFCHADLTGACSNPIQRVAPAHAESEEDAQKCPSELVDDGQDCPSYDQTVPEYDDRGRLSKLAVLREMQRKLAQRDVTPELAAQFLLANHPELAQRANATRQSQPQAVVPTPPPVRRYDDRLKSKKQRRLEKQHDRQSTCLSAR